MLAVAVSDKVMFVNISAVLQKPRILTSKDGTQYAAFTEQDATQTHAAKVQHMAFRPYFDDMGITATDMFEQILVPGSGRAEIDTYMRNVFASNRQKSEQEVR